MGRVIRHRHDYGAIILADERFRSDATRMQLSSWLRGSVTSHDTFGAATKSLQAFYRVRQSVWWALGMHGLGWEAWCTLLQRCLQTLTDVGVSVHRRSGAGSLPRRQRLQGQRLRECSPPAARRTRCPEAQRRAAVCR